VSLEEGGFVQALRESDTRLRPAAVSTALEPRLSAPETSVTPLLELPHSVSLLTQRLHQHVTRAPADSLESALALVHPALPAALSALQLQVGSLLQRPCLEPPPPPVIADISFELQPRVLSLEQRLAVGLQAFERRLEALEQPSELSGTTFWSDWHDVRTRVTQLTERAGVEERLTVYWQEHVSPQWQQLERRLACLEQSHTGLGPRLLALEHRETETPPGWALVLARLSHLETQQQSYESGLALAQSQCTALRDTVT